MPKYDSSRYDPPAPVVHVTLRDKDTGVLVPDVVLLLDTGADVTVFPRWAVERLGVKPLPGEEVELVGFNGTPSMAPAVDLDMIFLKRVFRGRYLVVEGEEGVLGRDVLNSVVIILDGPRQEWSEQQ